MDRENVYIYTMKYYSPVKNKDTKKFEGKWMALEKKNPVWSNPDQERQTWYVLIS